MADWLSCRQQNQVSVTVHLFSKLSIKMIKCHFYREEWFIFTGDNRKTKTYHVNVVICIFNITDRVSDNLMCITTVTTVYQLKIISGLQLILIDPWIIVTMKVYSLHFFENYCYYYLVFNLKSLYFNLTKSLQVCI